MQQGCCCSGDEREALGSEGVAGVVEPRFRSVAPAVSSMGGKAAKFMAAHGLKLDDWQALVLDGWLGVRADGKWAAWECGVNVPRQNGKGVILEARELYGLFVLGEELIIHSAHEFATSQEHFRRLEALIRNSGELHEQVKSYRHSHGEEGLELRDGRRILFRTRTKGGARGFSCDLLVLDEAMVIQEAAVAAMLPTLRSRSNPQVVYAGSAVDQMVHEHGVVWARIRERGVAGGDGELAYFEWSMDVDSVNELTPAIAEDPVQRQQANPSLGKRIDPAHMEREYKTMDLRSFGVELGGAGDWPSTEGFADFVIRPEDWLFLRDPESYLVDPVCLAFDVSPDRRASIAAAGRRADGLFHVEVIQNREGTSWLPERLAGIVEAHEVAVVKGDGYGPAASVAQFVEEAGVAVERVTMGELGQACGRLVDAVNEKTVRHLGSAELDDAIRGAKSRPLGDSWAWSRKTSHVDISPLVAATLALSAAMDQPEAGELQVW